MTAPYRRTAVFVGFVLLAAALTGCGTGNTTFSLPNTVPASGTVLLKNGKPAAGVTVKFLPQFDTGSMKWQPSGVTDKDGKFTLSTGAVGNGAPPGEYKVTFEFLQAGADKAGLDAEIDVWKGKYANPDTARTVTISSPGGALEAFKLD